jgi:hypothetical protein
MIHISAVQRCAEDLAEAMKPFRMTLALEAESPKALADSLRLLAASVDDIVRSVKEPPRR